MQAWRAEPRPTPRLGAAGPCVSVLRPSARRRRHCGAARAPPGAVEATPFALARFPGVVRPSALARRPFVPVREARPPCRALSSARVRRSLETLAWMFGIVAWLLLIAARGDAPTLPRATAPVETVSASGARLCVEVVGEDRRALPGAEVGAVLEEKERRFRPVREGKTDGAGRVCFDGVPRGPLWVIAEARGRARASRALTLGDDTKETFVL